jgi:hypothetical protein
MVKKSVDGDVDVTCGFEPLRGARRAAMQVKVHLQVMMLRRTTAESVPRTRKYRSWDANGGFKNISAEF